MAYYMDKGFERNPFLLADYERWKYGKVFPETQKLLDKAKERIKLESNKRKN